MPLPEASASFRDALRGSGALVMVVEGGVITESSDAAKALIGDDGHGGDALLHVLGSALAEAGGERTRAQLSTADRTGVERALSFEVSRLSGAPTPAFIAIGSDLTGRTGLPDPSVLGDRLRQALLTAFRQSASAAVMVIDVDPAADAADVVAPPLGGAELREVAARASSVIRDSDTLAQLDANRLVVLLPPPADFLSGLATSRKILEALSGSSVPSSGTRRITPTIGIAVYPGHGDSGGTLIDHATVALRTARRAGTRVAVYDSANGTEGASALSDLEELSTAIGSGELQLQYQPAVRLTDDRAVRLEALVRWARGGRGTLRPAAFVPLADRAGLGPKLTSWVLTQALGRCQMWRSEGLAAGVSINVSPSDLLDVGLPQRVRDTLHATGLEPRALSIDVSERSLGGEPARLERHLRALAQIGVRLALDDFGSGSASLKLLQGLPFTEVKLDGRYVKDVCTNIDDWSFVRSGIDAAHDLGLEVTAEGVEDKATAYVLRRLGCDVGQGSYFTARPRDWALLRAGELDSLAPN